jgi:carbon monoxide dehydrogenase subunit G
MAHYTTTTRTSLDPEQAFAFMADLQNLAAWDPGVSRVERLTEHRGLGARYEVSLRSALVRRLRYEVVAFEPPRSLRVVARTAWLESVDVMSVERTEHGTFVTYDATLTLRGPLRVLDRALQRAFDGLGDQAAAGLRRALSEGGLSQPREARSGTLTQARVPSSVAD